jgi:hypothetical protein
MAMVGADIASSKVVAEAIVAEADMPLTTATLLAEEVDLSRTAARRLFALAATMQWRRTAPLQHVPPQAMQLLLMPAHHSMPQLLAAAVAANMKVADTSNRWLGS